MMFLSSVLAASFVFTYGFFLFFDPMYMLIVALPAALFAGIAQAKVKTAYARAMRQPARMTGAEAARYMLDSSGLQDVRIEMVRGHLSDHYDPRSRVLRLSPDVYGRNTLASVGIAAHEAGHALQHAKKYAPLALRQFAAPAATVGPGIGMVLIILGMIFSATGVLFGQMFITLGLAFFSVIVFFQVVTLPVEFNASTRAKVRLAELGVVSEQEMPYVRGVLNAAALTYVAAAFQAIMMLLYLVMRFSGGRD